MEEIRIFFEDLVQISRLALTGRTQDIQLYIRRLSKKYRTIYPEVADSLTALLRESPTRSSPLRKETSAPIPVDLDSRLHLIRFEDITELGVEPIFEKEVYEKLHQIIAERKNQESLFRVGLTPTRSVLFTGEPGVGKSLAARWLAHTLCLPLLTLDLSAVMSSFLGRTGNNLRHVLDYAKSVECILLLDELDAIAKRRDDVTEVGELKRLVTVLLQEIDDWPAEGILVAATNHPALLDPAVWRRFESKIDFPMPNETSVRKAVIQFLGQSVKQVESWIDVLSTLFLGISFNDIERELLRVRRSATLNGGSLKDCLLSLVQSRIESIPRNKRADLASSLVESGCVTQRLAHEITGVSRDTIRKKTSASEKNKEKQNG